MNVSNFPNIANSIATQANSTSNSTKIHEAAQQFEALMITEMLKSVRENGSAGLSDDSQDAGQDSMTGMAESTFANALAKGGGLGLSNMIEQSVSKQAGTQKENTASRPTSGVSIK